MARASCSSACPASRPASGATANEFFIAQVLLQGRALSGSRYVPRHVFNTITVGESAELNEMCMAVGYYFPATSQTFCLNSFTFGR
jgi:hypothetical protein